MVDNCPIHNTEKCCCSCEEIEDCADCCDTASEIHFNNLENCRYGDGA